MRISRKYIYPVLACLILSGTQAVHAADGDADRVHQSTKAERNYIRNGNQAYRDGQYHKALEDYENALSANPYSLKAAYNKGLALLQLASDDNKDTANDPRQISEEIFKQVAALAVNVPEEIELAERSLYNLGNLAFNDEDYQKSIELYKKALRINPDNKATRQNLRLAQLKLENQDNQDNLDNQDNQDQQQDQNQQQQQQDQQQNQQDQQDQQDQQQNQQEQQQQKQQMTGSAQQILQSMQNKENATRRKVQQQEQDQPSQGRPMTDKPW